MKFTLMSDLHLDFPQAKIPYNELEEYVVIPGDTSNGLLGLKFLNKLRNKGYKVFAGDGNHEHYSNLSQNRTHAETLSRFREDNPAEGFLGEIPIIVVNGWYHISDPSYWANYMNDRLSGLDYSEVNELAREDCVAVYNSVANWKKPGIVATHTAPCMETLDPRFEGQFSNEWYFNPWMRQVMEDFPDKIAVWCHGHTHAFADKTVNGVRIVCNPRGYPSENPSWKPFTVEI